MNLDNGSIRLFRLAGIDVLVHWSWAVAAYFILRARADEYSTPFWNIIQYVTLFGIVLLHEFGHALACRSVGGQVERIVLWPLGGIAYVNPPPRPGAVLWSIAAGPLVNVFLVPITVGLWLFSRTAGWQDTYPDLSHFLFEVMWINAALLIFNLLPVYPLDGGQILQALLWFVIGRARSLMVVSFIGLIVGAGVVILAVKSENWWLMIIALFVAMQSLNGFRASRMLSQLARAPRHQGLACPSCGAAPLAGPYWRCDQCGQAFDTFEHHASCPNCGQRFKETACAECRQRHPIDAWWGVPTPADDASGSI